MKADDASIPSGGEVIDLRTEKDRGLIRQAVKSWPKRWRGMTPEFKDKCIQQLSEALAEVDLIEDVDKRVMARTSIVKTAAVIEGQNQKDEHIEVEQKNPQVVEHRHFVVPPPRVLGESNG